MHASPARGVPLATDGPHHMLLPQRPYVFAFALTHPPVRAERINLGEPVTVVIADGARQPHEPHDWFTARLPAIPPVTGPLHVTGVSPGDTLEIEVLTIGAVGPMPAPLRRLTVTVTGRPSEASDPAPVTIPVGGVARIPVHRQGGMLTVGPVVASNGADDVGVPIAANVTLRCSVMLVPRT